MATSAIKAPLLPNSFYTISASNNTIDVPLKKTTAYLVFEYQGGGWGQSDGLYAMFVGEGYAATTTIHTLVESAGTPGGITYTFPDPTTLRMTYTGIGTKRVVIIRMY